MARDYTEEEITKKIANEISETSGLGPCNFTPFTEVLNVIGCRRVSMKDRGDPVIFESPGLGMEGVVCGLSVNEEGMNFHPWPAGTALRGEEIEIPTQQEKARTNNWYYRTKQLKNTATLTLNDNRADQLKKKPLKIFHFMVYLRIGRVRTVTELHTHMKNSMPRECYYENDMECGTEVSKITVSLKCPIMGTAITVPVRPRKCAHEQVWDLSTHLMLLSEQRHPPKGIRCQICDKAYQFKELVVDLTFLNVIAEGTSIARNTVFTAAQWESYKTPRPQHSETVSRGAGGELLQHVVGSTKGSLLKPVLLMTHLYTPTSTLLDIPPDAKVLNGKWISYPDIPTRYFIVEG
eukprot:TRINITY_DN34599_c0_g1_i1.p1 TRINITY_DN34599_c0_g1~~TRINITY_DN34599_c0_g1_i1.p1  ORF type:complete len:350 (+),score=49.71 TRINITY_DN34599_c0_g1_i1:71-1120(+)